MPAFEPVTKFNATVDDVARFPDMVRQAFRVAMSGHARAGASAVPRQRGPGRRRRGRDGAAGRGAVRARAAVPAGARRRRACARRSRCLQEAERPVIVAGGGVRASGAAAELVALAEALQIPVATSLNGKDSIPGNHPLSVGVVGTYSRESANRVVNGADLVCFVGTETGGMTTHFWAVPKIGTPAIQIDIDAEALGRNYPLQAAVQRRRQGDARAHARARRPRQRGAARAPGSPRCERSARTGAPSTSRRWTSRRGADPAGAHLPRAHAAHARRRHRGGRHRPRRHVDGRLVRSHAARARATSAAPAISAGRSRPGSAPNARCPERPVVTFTGDAGFWYHIAEIETAVRWKINAVTVVNNNAGGNQSKRGFDRVYGGKQTEQARELWTFSKMNFARIAEDMGAVGIRVEKPGEIGRRARARAEGRPAGGDRRGDRHRRAGAAGGDVTPFVGSVVARLSKSCWAFDPRVTHHYAQGIETAAELRVDRATCHTSRSVATLTHPTKPAPRETRDLADGGVWTRRRRRRRTAHATGRPSLSSRASEARVGTQ